MKVTLRYLALLTVFGVGLAVVYWFVTYEVTGTVLLVSFAAMPAIVVVYARLHGVAAARGPEDDPGADQQRSAGETLGPFPSATVWPVFLVLGLVVLGAALIYGLILLPVGVGLLAWAVFGLMRESRN